MQYNQKEANLPAQIFITKEQIAWMHELGENVIVNEPPGRADMLDIWVMDEEGTWENHHRSVVVDPEGRPLVDHDIDDDTGEPVD